MRINVADAEESYYFNYKMLKPKRIDFNENLEKIHECSFNNKELIERSTKVGCFYCCRIYLKSEIKEWSRDSTAICPYCSIDAVLPDSRIILSQSFLREMSSYWFSGGILYKGKDGLIVDMIDEKGMYNPEEFELYKAQELERFKKTYEKHLNSKIISKNA